MKLYISIACISIFLSSGSAAAENTNCLIVLTAESQAETQEAIKTIEYFGGEVRHVFVPDVLIGYVPPAIDQTIKERNFISMVVREELDVADWSYDIKASRLAISAWTRLLGGTPLVNDVHPSLHQLMSDEGESVDILTVEEADKYTSSSSPPLAVGHRLILVVDKGMNGTVHWLRDTRSIPNENRTEVRE